MLFKETLTYLGHAETEVYIEGVLHRLYDAGYEQKCTLVADEIDFAELPDGFAYSPIYFGSPYVRIEYGIRPYPKGQKWKIAYCIYRWDEISP